MRVLAEPVSVVEGQHRHHRHLRGADRETAPIIEYRVFGVPGNRPILAREDAVAVLQS